MTIAEQLARKEILALDPPHYAAVDPALERLHANENAQLTSSNAAADRDPIHHYPDPTPERVEAALAKLYGVGQNQVLAGRGSDEGIDLLVRAFVSAGTDAIMVFPPTFGMYKLAARIQGGEVIEIPLLRGDTFSIDEEAFRQKWEPRVKIVFFCSPNNPTGNLADRGIIERALRHIAGRAIVIVDEAYIEFAESPSFVGELAKYRNLVVLRTLSKAHGLAGARCGAVIADPSIIDLLRRIRPPYSIPSPTTHEVLKALESARVESARTVASEIRKERAILARALSTSPFVKRVWPSDANFLLVECSDARAFVDASRRAGFLLRDFADTPGLEGCVRVSVGTRKQHERLVRAVGGSL